MLLKQVDSAGAAGAQRMSKEGQVRDRLVQTLRTELDTIRTQVVRAKRRLSQIEDEHYELFIKLVPKRAEVQQMTQLRGTAKMAEQRYHDAHEQRERLEYEVDSYQMIFERIAAELPGRASAMAQLVQALRTERDVEEEARLAARRSLASREAAERLLAAAHAELEQYRGQWREALEASSAALEAQREAEAERARREEARKQIALNAAGLGASQLEAQEAKLLARQMERRMSTSLLMGQVLCDGA